MRTARISVDGADYLLCFSARVVRDCTERYGDIGSVQTVLNDDDKVKALDEAVWMISRMMDAGARYAKLNGLDNPPPLSMDDLYDVCDISDFSGLRGKIQETITNGQTARVEAEPQKNAGTAQGGG